jgi:excisionase family DNA binding protein
MRLLTAKQTAEILQVSPARVYALARLNLLPSVRLGRQIRFEDGALREFIVNGGAADTRPSEVRR